MLLFGRKKTPAELLRQHQRALQKAQREMDREKAKLDLAEKKLIADIKKSAKANQVCEYLTEISYYNKAYSFDYVLDLVRTRRYSQKFQAMKTQLQAVSLRIQEEDEEESDMIVNQVLDEIGISLDQSLVDTPSSIEKETTKEKVPQIVDMESNDDAALQARLDNLRRE
ncbi:7764_t:CDS:2 [Racocetra fulgida]|uniref:7764_t:CDS:1 n=1 Tax=Racocetra fulgida TaxID=60492 RepID=A0A9N9GJY3_9GLOM|nr:7764_t:CDS:2 [Racocetra fulgida]